MKKYLKNLTDEDNPKFVTDICELSFWSAPFGMTLLNTIKLKWKIKVLDIGCGTGFPLLELSGRLGDSSKIYGIDTSSKAIETATEKISFYEITNAEALVATAEKLPFENNIFDLIVSNNGINNVQDLDKTISECFRTLKPCGQFVFTYNLPETMSEFYNVFKSALEELGLLKEIQKLHDHIFEKRKPVDYMEKIVMKSGLKIKEIIKSKFNYRFTDGISFFSYPMIRYRFVPPWKKILPEQRVEEVFTLLENKLNEVSSKKGELVMTIPYVCFDCYK